MTLAQSLPSSFNLSLSITCGKTRTLLSVYIRHHEMLPIVGACFILAGLCCPAVS